jgi:hypothetical protein
MCVEVSGNKNTEINLLHIHLANLGLNSSWLHVIAPSHSEPDPNVSNSICHSFMQIKQ